MATEKDLEATISADQAAVSDPNGQLHRSLKERHVQFIALGGTIGTGLFLGIGSALATSGPLSLWLGYCFTSVAIWAMVSVDHSLALLLITIPCFTDAMPGGNGFLAPSTWYGCPAGRSFR